MSEAKKQQPATFAQKLNATQESTRKLVANYSAALKSSAKTSDSRTPSSSLAPSRRK